MEITEVKKLIPRGYRKAIAEKAGVSERSVSYVLSGQRKSHKIEMAILEVAVSIKKERTRLESKL